MSYDLSNIGLDDVQVGKVKEIISDYEEKIKKIELDSNIENSLLKSKAKNIKAVKALLNTDNLEIKDGKIQNIEEQIKKLKQDESTAFLFETESKNSFKGIKPEESIKSNISDINKMNYSQFCQYLEQNPDAKI